MRMSCNGCRVLRKGCSDNCSIRPCLQWIKSAESQANATVFLAKFYGRAGLMNLLNAGPDHLRPAIFRSLLYEACGRIVNPINGSVGLLWSGNWHLCQAAVEAVMRGAPVTPIACDAVTGHAPPFNKVYDIRHVSRDENSSGIAPIASNDGFKHTKSRFRSRKSQKGVEEVVLVQGGAEWGRACGEKEESPSHDSSLSHQSSVKDEGSMVSEETTVEPSYMGLGLELTLGLEPVSRGAHVMPVKKRKMERFEEEEEEDKCRIELGLVSE